MPQERVVIVKKSTSFKDSAKYLLAGSVAISLMLLMPTKAFAMHIAEGFLQPGWCIAWGAVCIPFLVAGFLSIKQKIVKSPKSLVLLALCGAFAFVLSALKIPSVTGSSSHPTGVGLGAVLFGPLVSSVLSLIVLLFQAILLAHGGITTLGANVFSMGIVGPLLAFATYKLAKKLHASSGVAVFLAAFVGDISTYITTAFQLAIAFPDGGSVLASLIKFLNVFAITQLPLAVCEGLLTVVVFGVVEKYGQTQLEYILE